MTCHSEELIPPKVFVSYSWDSEAHRSWVRALGAQLRSDGVDVTLDQWHLVPGDQLPEFMERAIRDNDFVLIVCTPKYKTKSEQRSGGVGFEGDVMCGEALVHGNHRKFIPLLRQGEWAEAAPSWLLGKYYVDLRSEPYSPDAYAELLSAVFGGRPKPPILGRARVPAESPVNEPQSTMRRLNLLEDLSAEDMISGNKQAKEARNEDSKA